MSEANLGRLRSVLLGPLVSEKTTKSGERENSVTFWVKPDVNKHEIKQAIEHFFPNVKVESVRTIVKQRPFVTFANRKGRGKKRKKAYIKLAKGTEIQLTDFE